MSPVFRLLFCLSFIAVTSAQELRVNVLDPRSAPVAGATLALYRTGEASPVATQLTSATGQAVFAHLAPATYRLQVLAPGFSRRVVPIVFAETVAFDVKLAVTASGQTVLVTATRTPVPLEQTGAAVSFLDAGQLQDLQPSSAGEALRFLPGAVVIDAGRRGGITSLFVRGGESRYNKIIVDNVPINDAGGTFNFGVVPVEQMDRLELLRGPGSALYGSDAMTSVVQLWTATGHTRVPELRFGADGGNLSTAHGFASLAGAAGPFDYNVFGSQFNTQGQGINDQYSNSLVGANLGVLLSPQVTFRLRGRHSNARSGVPGEWNFNGNPFLAPDADQHGRNTTFLASADLAVAASPHWQHRFTGAEYNEHRFNIDSIADRDCANFFIDCPFVDFNRFNRAGFGYQGDWSPRSWAHSTFGYEFEDENGLLKENSTGILADPGDKTHGLRRNHAIFGQQFLQHRRASLLLGGRYVHNESFGNKFVPQATLTILALPARDFFSGTRFYFSYGQGIKEPRFEESFGLGLFVVPNLNLRPEQNRSLEAGVQQNFSGGKYFFSASYFNNLFSSQIAFQSFGPPTFAGQYTNLNRSLAHGSEVELRARPSSSLSLSASYVYTSTQVLSAPFAFDPLFARGAPLIRRPRHSGSLLATYAGLHWGANFGGTFLGRRADSDFLFGAVPPANHTAGYARFDLGGWRALNHYTTAYVNIENLFNRHYEDVAGYPGLRFNFRAGLRFRIGGD